MTPTFIIFSAIFTFVIAHMHDGDLIESFRCSDPDPTLNGWTFGGTHFLFSSTQDSPNCPLPDGAPCYALSAHQISPAGWAENTFNTYGYYNIWVSIDVHAVGFEFGDQAWITFSDGKSFHSVLIADDTIITGSVVTPILVDTMDNNPDCRFTIQMTSETTNYADYFYFSNVKIYGTKITTKPPTSITKSPTTSTLAPTSIPSKSPIAAPTISPTSFNPTFIPTSLPSISPTVNPTSSPTFNPTTNPTDIPTQFPSVSPTAKDEDIQLHVDGSLETTQSQEKEGEILIDDVETTNNPFIGREEEGDAFYFLIIGLVAVIATTFISVLIGLCYFCRMDSKPKQQRVRSLDHLDSPTMSQQVHLKESPQMQSIELESHENDQIQMIISTPSMSPPPLNQPKMIEAYSSMDVDKIRLDKLMAPSASQLEGRVKKMSLSDLYDEMDDEPHDQIVGTTTGGTDDGSDEVLLQNKREQDDNDNDDGIYDAAGVSPSEANTLDPSDALPETTRDDKDK